MPEQDEMHTEPPIERIVVDECLAPDSQMLAQLTQRLGGPGIEVVLLTMRHPGIPDIEILDKLLDDRTALLTRDRVLHNLAISREFRSFFQLAEGGLTNRTLPGVDTTDRRQPAASGGLQDTYRPKPDPEAQAIVASLAANMTAQQLKQFRTKRRRIRAHFGSLDNIAATALTIGQIRTPQGTIGGCQLKVDARHGVKGLSPASESYFLDRSPHHEPLQSVVWALAQLFMLQLHSRPLTLFVCHAGMLHHCRDLTAGGDTSNSAVARAACRLLGATCDARVEACVKGRFFDRMQAKLDQLAAVTSRLGTSNELVPINGAAIAAALTGTAATHWPDAEEL